MNKDFVIVKFTLEDDDVGIIPRCWITNDMKHCYYPNVANDARRNKLLKAGEMPDSLWPIHEISIMKSYGKFIVFLQTP